jgi:SAM-dependent methyltransferase
MKTGIKAFSKRLPWWLKMWSKVALSRLPVTYQAWQRIGIFRHGEMDAPDYALRVFDIHVANCGMQGALDGKRVLELGPGDSVATAIIAYSYGARAILVDTGRFASNQPVLYKRLAHELNRRGLKPPLLDGADDIEEVVQRCGASYLTGGLHDVKKISDQSVDLIFSQAVLEHVRRHQFDELMRECRRVLVNTGAASHVVDLKDHLGGGANNLRISHQLWESDLLSNSGFYTNRLRCAEMLASMTKAGFVVSRINRQSHDKLPISRHHVHPDIVITSDEDLLIKEIKVLLLPM